MNRRRLLAALAAILPTLLLWAGCGDDRLAGGGEILNPPGKLSLSGRILDPDEKPGAGARVLAIPEGFDPVADSAGARPSGWTDTAHADGRYTLTGLDSGRYVVWAEEAGKGRRLLVPGIHPVLGGDPTSEARLRIPGAIAFTLPDSLFRPGAYVYMAGTPLYLRLQSFAGETPRLVLDGVPAGLMPGIYYRDPAQSSPRLLFGPGIRVLSADTLPLDVLPAWKESRRLTLDEGNAAGIASALADYPLMVRLDAANFDFASAAADGRDVRFTRRDGRPIPHEIEAWDAVARKAVLWVKVDSILPGGRTPSFRIHWGNPAASDASDPARVFSDTTWTGVWHSAASSGAPPRLEDASIGANPAFVAGLRSGIAIGETPFGRGLQLLGDTTTLYTLKTFDRPSLFTLSIWFQTDTDSGGRIIGFNRQAARIDTADVRDRHLWMDDAGRLHFGVYESGVPADSARHVLTAPAPLNDGRWHHAAASLSPAGLAFFVDGSKVGEDPTLSIGQVGSGVWRMGFEPGFTDWPDPPSAASFRGALDEARIDRTALSAERIRLDYLSQRPGGGLLKLRVH